MLDSKLYRFLPHEKREVEVHKGKTSIIERREAEKRHTSCICLWEHKIVGSLLKQPSCYNSRLLTNNNNNGHINHLLQPLI